MRLLVSFAKLKQFSETCHVPFWRKILLRQLNYPIKVKPLHSLPRSDNLKVRHVPRFVRGPFFFWFRLLSFVIGWLDQAVSEFHRPMAPRWQILSDIIYIIYSLDCHMLLICRSIVLPFFATALHQIRNLHPARSLRTSSDTTPLQCPSAAQHVVSKNGVAVEISPWNNGDFTRFPGKACWCPVSEVIQKWSFIDGGFVLY